MTSELPKDFKREPMKLPSKKAGAYPDGFTPRGIQLSPETVEARRIAREKRMNMTLDERVKEIQERRRLAREEALRQVWKEHKTEIILSSLFTAFIIIAPAILLSLF